MKSTVHWGTQASAGIADPVVSTGKDRVLKGHEGPREPPLVKVDSSRPTSLSSQDPPPFFHFSFNLDNNDQSPLYVLSNPLFFFPPLYYSSRTQSTRNLLTDTPFPSRHPCSSVGLVHPPPHNWMDGCPCKLMTASPRGPATVPAQPSSAVTLPFSPLCKPPGLWSDTRPSRRSSDSEAGSPCPSHSTLLFPVRVPVTTIHICLPSFMCIVSVSSTT